MDTVKLRKLVVHAYKSYIKYRTFCTLSVITVLILGLGFSQRANLQDYWSWVDGTLWYFLISLLACEVWRESPN